MSDTLKKLVKYLVIIGLLGAVVFFGIKILFPTPSSTLAFEKSKAIANNEHFEQIKTSNKNFESKYAYAFAYQPHLRQELSYSINVVAKQLDVLKQIYPELAFAKNSSVYNSKANELKKQEEAVSSAFQNAIDFIEGDFATVYNQSTPPSAGVLKAIAINLTDNNKALSKNLTKFINNASTIYNNLETNFLANPYSKKIVQISTTWINVHNSFLNDPAHLENENFNYEKAHQNLNAFASFLSNNLTNSSFLSYNTNKANLDLILQNLSKSNTQGLLSVLEISDADTFINSIENEEIKTSTQSLKTFILGGV